MRQSALPGNTERNSLRVRGRGTSPKVLANTEPCMLSPPLSGGCDKIRTRVSGAVVTFPAPFDTAAGGQA